MATHGPRWLTRRGYEMVKCELDRLLLVYRSAAENHDDPATREQRQWQEARMKQLHELLLTATVDEQPPDDGVAEPGMVVTVRYDDGALETYLLATRETSALGSIEVCSPESPLGRALMGAKENESRTYVLPTGGTMSVTLHSAKPFVEAVA